MPDAVPAFVWVEGPVAPGAHVTLDETAAHHVVRVCRARIGDSVAVTDGRGAVGACRVARLTPHVSLEVESVDRIERARSGVLLCGAPEGQRFDWVVEKLAELGVTRVRPVECDRGPWARAAVRPERWKRVAVAALEQSRGRFLLEIETPLDLEEALEREGKPGLGVLADPEGMVPGAVRPADSMATVAVVGPAAGFSEAEKAAILGRGFVPMALAGSRLRTETAAVAWAAWWAAPRDP